MSALTQLPDAFLDRLRLQFRPDVFSRIVDGMESERVTSFRANGLLCVGDPLEELEKSGLPLFRIDGLPGAAYTHSEHRQRLLSSPAYVEKRIYVQNLASMLPVSVLSPVPGERILDLTAAPGSKTLQIAERAGETSEIAAVELVKGRFFRLKANLEEYGAPFVRTFLQDGRRVWKYRTEYFDRVLVDAPCSSEGRFTVTDPESYAYWSPRKVGEMARKQRKLLFSAIQAVRPGGTVVYSTCSLSAEENEGIISKMLNRFGDAVVTEPFDPIIDEAIEPLESWRGKPFHPMVEHSRRILPSARTEGFFICKLTKRVSTVDQKA